MPRIHGFKRIQDFTGHYAGCSAVFGGNFAGDDDKTNALRRGVRAAEAGKIRAVANRFGIKDDQIRVHARADAALMRKAHRLRGKLPAICGWPSPGA